MRFDAIMENPSIPAPLAVNLLLSRRTSGESIISIGIRLEPMKSPVMLQRALCWAADVSASRYIRDTFCPEVPDEVILLIISSSGTLFKSMSLKSVTGR